MHMEEEQAAANAAAEPKVVGAQGEFPEDPKIKKYIANNPVD